MRTTKSLFVIFPIDNYLIEGVVTSHSEGLQSGAVVVLRHLENQDFNSIPTALATEAARFT